MRRAGSGLNRLAARIGDLLAHERETVADLSHRLRTPLTALRIDAESLRNFEEMTQLTADVDAVYRRATAAGAEIIAEPHDTDYGSHDFAARDPEGNRWSFGTYRGEPRKAP